MATATPEMAAAGIVLCGGRSSRMGRAKALLPWAGASLVAHVVATLKPVVDEIVVVGSADLELPPLDATVVRDREPALGPLSGIREGLAAMRSQRAFVTATDAPFLSRDFVRAMLACGAAAAPVVDGYVQTLAAVYPRSALALAERMLEARRLRPLELLEELGFERLEAGSLPDVEGVSGFNTPSEYLAAARRTFDAPTATLEFLGRARLQMGRREVSVPIGTLREVLGRMRPNVEIFDGEAIARAYLVALDGRDFVRNPTIPIGPGERVSVMDASVGG